MRSALRRRNNSETVDDLVHELTRARDLKSSLSQQELETALVSVAEFLKANWDTHGGVQVRHFAWSLWNQRHFVNLCSLCVAVDSGLRAHLETIFVGACRGALNETQLRNLLAESGELARWQEKRDQTPPHTAVDYPSEISCSIGRSPGKM